MVTKEDSAISFVDIWATSKCPDKDYGLNSRCWVHVRSA